jgi:hypothetical protein
MKEALLVISLVSFFWFMFGVPLLGFLPSGWGKIGWQRSLAYLVGGPLVLLLWPWLAKRNKTA